jgi:hypothetical protein
LRYADYERTWQAGVFEATVSFFRPTRSTNFCPRSRRLHATRRQSERSHRGSIAPRTEQRSTRIVRLATGKLSLNLSAKIS